MEHMQQAISLAKLALGQASPNPAVGAVIVRDGEIVGQGYTQPAGSSHAEIMALNQAGEKARGGVMYVTLEPCSHQGKTPPCTKAIIENGISEVHMAMIDPNPKVSGRGEEQLIREGIKTYVGEMEEEAREIVESHVKYIITGTPFITVKFSASLDGKIATKSGNSRWISGEESRKYVHHLRYIHDAIMAGANTVIEDNPRLTCRYAGKGGEVKQQPLRVIVDGKGRTSAVAQVFNESGKALLVVDKKIDKEKKAEFAKVDVELLELPSKDGIIDLRKLMKNLGEREITSVLVEGGGILQGSLFDQGLVDKVIAFISPVIIGGKEAVPTIAGKGVETMADALRLERITTERFGDDIMICGYVGKRKG
jgi:diaminohydroxyphosphoribosylaminopyrimidine deaminase/5-amino-6-(5-phosphoribosylamino)uracil reductase